MKIKTMLVASAIFATPAMAAPTYLDCTMKGGKAEPTPLTLAVSEERGTVTWTKSLETITARASFTADSIVWSDFLDGFSLNRQTLQLDRFLAVGGQAVAELDSRQCKVSARKNVI